MKNIPLGRPYIKPDIVLAEIEKVLDTRWISGGPTIGKFEDAIKAYNSDDNGHYVAVANGTVALELALMLANDGDRLLPVDEVIVPSWSWVASGFAVDIAGGTPVWCDVDEFGCPSVDTIEPLISTFTKAIIIVHQMGVPCDIDAITEMARKYNIQVIEDGACAIGSEYKGKRLGNTENIFTYSFQARKALTTGEGGMVVVRHPADADWLRSMRAFGTNVSPLERDRAQKLMKENFPHLGTNYKISDITAAVGLAHLQYLDEEIELRTNAGWSYHDKIYAMSIEGYPIRPANLVPDFCTRYNWQNYHVVLNENVDRDDVVDRLRKEGIGCKWDIQAIHKEPLYDGAFDDLKLPVTDVFHNSGLWLPFYAEITEEDQDYVLGVLGEILNDYRQE